MDSQSYKKLFLSEARERVDVGFHLVERLRTGGGEAPLRDLMRQAHSLKGMAATMGYEPIVRLAHAMEDLLELLDEPAHRDEPPVALLADTLACLGTMIDEIEHDRADSSPRAEELRTRLVAQLPSGGSRPASTIAAPRQTESATSAANAPEQTIARPVYRVLLDLAETNPVDGGDPTVRVLGNLASLGTVIRVHPPQMSVKTGRFNRFLRVVLASDLEAEELTEILRCDTGIAELAVETTDERAEGPVTPEAEEPAWVRVRCDLLDRALDSSLETLVSIHREDATGLRNGRARRVGRATYDLLRELRMVPLESIFGRLRQAAHEAAAAVDKSVELTIEDDDTWLDRGLLEQLVDPLVHLVRNAVDHGIEAGPARRERGKPATGKLELRVTRLGERVRIELRDDGGGIDLDAVRRSAVRRGWYSTAQAQALTDTECRKLLFRPGFSTRTEAGTLSGRGIGMDIVKRHVDGIGGHLSIDAAEVGTVVTLDLPLSQSLVRSLLVVQDGERYAIPARTVRAVRAPEPATDDGEIPAAASEGCTVELETESGTTRFAVDEVIDERDLIVHPLGPPLRRMRRFAGAAVLEDGEIVLVLDPGAAGIDAVGASAR